MDSVDGIKYLNPLHHHIINSQDQGSDRDKGHTLQYFKNLMLKLKKILLNSAGLRGRIKVAVLLLAHIIFD